MKGARLVDNEDGDHVSVLLDNLKRAVRFTCVVAFAKWSGYDLISHMIETRIDAGMRATIVVGIDFFQTEPKVLKELLRLTVKHPGLVQAYMGAEDHEFTMHPKMYLFTRKDGTSVSVVGSANMTKGGLRDNHEFSALVSGVDWEPKVHAWIGSQVRQRELVEVNAPAIERYDELRDVFLLSLQLAQKRAKRIFEGQRDDLGPLRLILEGMKADDSDEGFAIQSARRAGSTAKAAAVLSRMTRRKPLDRRGFLEAYDRLASGLWHSGGLHRAKTTIAERSDTFQQALRELEADEGDDPARLYERLRKTLGPVSKAGVNVMTEILHTRDPMRFAVMNQNSVSGMAKARVTGYPAMPTKKVVDGPMYARFCADADRIRAALGLGDLRELDALFNYSYWT